MFEQEDSVQQCYGLRESFAFDQPQSERVLDKKVRQLRIVKCAVVAIYIFQFIHILWVEDFYLLNVIDPGGEGKAVEVNTDADGG